MGVRVLELFCGIGGCAAALPTGADVVAAVDQKPRALAVYRDNFGHATHAWNLVGVRSSRLPDADLWWLSPPCQPYTVRGKRRDLDDPRAASLVRVLELIAEVRPPMVALENVRTFDGSRAHALVRSTLADAGYTVAELHLCPTALGVPNARRRFYLAAARLRDVRFAVERRPLRRLAAYLDDAIDPALRVEPALLERFGHALHVVDPRDDDAVAACFTSAYGRSPVYAGSYLHTAAGPRRFSPDEVVRLLGFPERFRWPASLSLRHRWDLAGNSLSVHAVRTVLDALGVR